MPDSRHLELEENFKTWLSAARAAFNTIIQSDDASFITKQATQNFAINLNEAALTAALGDSSSARSFTPKEHIITDSSKPWIEK
jgi:hypothetical protein